MRLKDVAAILVALAMTGALIWYVTGSFLLNPTVLAVVVVLIMFAGLGHLITRDPARSRVIVRNKALFILAGLVVMLAAAIAAIATHHFRDLTREGFGLVTVVFLAGLEIAYLPRACWWDGRFKAKRMRLPPEDRQ